MATHGRCCAGFASVAEDGPPADWREVRCHAVLSIQAVTIGRDVKGTWAPKVQNMQLRVRGK
jgi:hypothetical protein